jgi:extracellular elastinolytic metalloproteinase
MHISSKTSLALILLGSALSYENPISRCKTMGVGPVWRPYSKFLTTPISSTAAFFFNSNPCECARSFVSTLSEEEELSEDDFVFCKGSYTSKVAGLTVTHAFYRQIMNGVEVAGCEITVDVMGSRVISYTGSKSVSIVVGPSLLWHLLHHASLLWLCAQHL